MVTRFEENGLCREKNLPELILYRHLVSSKIRRPSFLYTQLFTLVFWNRADLWYLKAGLEKQVLAFCESSTMKFAPPSASTHRATGNLSHMSWRDSLPKYLVQQSIWGTDLSRDSNF